MTQVEINGQAFTLPYSKGGKGHYYEILQKIVDQTDAMLSHHCKVLIFRIDLHLYDDTANSEQLSRFFRRLKKRDEALGA